jgi:hypothetical protein
VIILERIIFPANFSAEMETIKIRYTVGGSGLRSDAAKPPERPQRRGAASEGPARPPRPRNLHSFFLAYSTYYFSYLCIGTFEIC